MHEACQSGLIVDLSGQVRYLVPQAARHSHVDTLDMGVCVCVCVCARACICRLQM